MLLTPKNYANFDVYAEHNGIKHVEIWLDYGIYNDQPKGYVLALCRAEAIGWPERGVRFTTKAEAKLFYKDHFAGRTKDFPLK